MTTRIPSYQCQGTVMLRASTAPSDLDIPDNLFESSGPRSATDWIVSLWERPQVRDALEQASPGLCAQIHKVLSGEVTDPKRVRSMVLSVVAYVLRWRRATPFGLFAGVAPAEAAENPAVRWGSEHRMVARADAEWVADIIDHLHRFPALMERLDIVANNAASVRGNRVVVPGQSADGHTDLAAPIEVSVRHSAPVAEALSTAHSPIRYSHLRDYLNARFPTAGTERVTALLDQLISQHLLHTSLWAPMTHPDALGHLCQELDRVGSHDIGELSHLVDLLRTVHKELADPLPTASWPRLAPVAEQMRTLTDVTPTPVITDTVVDAHLQIPKSVAHSVEEMADVLTRVSAHPFGAPHWRDYHHRFRNRYGPGAVVPLLELLADSGLGWPAGYLGANRSYPPRLTTDRDRLLLDLVQQATTGGHREIVLDEDLITRLGPAQGERITPPPQIELCVRLHTPSAQALAAGDFTLEMRGLPLPGSSLIGRFAHLLTDRAGERIAHSYSHPRPDVLTAQLAFPPRKRRNDNITRAPRLLSHVLPLAQPPGVDGQVVDLTDVAVTADAAHLYLVRASTGQQLHIQTEHALEAGTQTPPLARFLSEVTTARYTVYGAFDFGAASRLTHLPRVRYRNAVLASARWLLPDLRSTTYEEWAGTFSSWCERWQVPDRIVLVEQDRRLPLDLSHPVHRRLLHHRCTQHERVELREDLTAEGDSWPGRPHELVFSLHSRQETPAPPANTHRATGSRAEAAPLEHEILAADLFAHPDRFDDILADHVPELVEALPAQIRWWFTRHRDLARPDADPYLRLHLSTSRALRPQVMDSTHTWAQKLRERRLLAHLSLTTTTPQTGRYGHGSAIDAAQEVFAADTTATLAQLRVARTTGIPTPALTAASMFRLVTDFLSLEQGMDWLISLPHTPGTVDRSHRGHALKLIDQTSEHSPTPGRDDLARSWSERSRSLARYHEHLTDQRDPATVLRSLLHLHHVRALGASPEQEAATLRIARSLALAQRARGPR